MELFFWMHERAQGKARPRFSHGHAFTPQKTREFEKRIRAKAESLMIQKGLFPSQLPVRIKITAFFAVPKSYRKSFKESVKQKQFIPHTKKPDADNLTKAVKDALNGLVYLDDAQCFFEICEKYYHDGEDCFSVYVTDEEDFPKMRTEKVTKSELSIG